MILFSIITVTYNNLAGLERTHESLRQQSCQDFEWIVIDGNSNDGTVEYLKSSAASWISEPDKGIYDAMNKGMEKVRRDYVLFLNAGDALAGPEILQKLQNNIEGQGVLPDFIYGDSLEAREDKNLVYKTARSHKKAAYGLFTHHQAMLYNRTLIGDLRYDTGYGIAADYKFTLQFLKRCTRVLYCPYALCLYEGGGLSQQQVRKGRAEQFQIRRREINISWLQNSFIYAGQWLFIYLRRLMPGLYWKLKQKRY